MKLIKTEAKLVLVPFTPKEILTGMYAIRNTDNLFWQIKHPKLFDRSIWTPVLPHIISNDKPKQGELAYWFGRYTFWPRINYSPFVGPVASSFDALDNSDKQKPVSMTFFTSTDSSITEVDKVKRVVAVPEEIAVCPQLENGKLTHEFLQHIVRNNGDCFIEMGEDDKPYLIDGKIIIHSK